VQVRIRLYYCGGELGRPETNWRKAPAVDGTSQPRDEVVRTVPQAKGVIQNDGVLSDVAECDVGHDRPFRGRPEGNSESLSHIDRFRYKIFERLCDAGRMHRISLSCFSLN
jgi:hypothetical protein